MPFDLPLSWRTEWASALWNDLALAIAGFVLCWIFGWRTVLAVHLPLMMIAGFETPTAGDIAIDGTSVVAMPPYRRNIGMVFQNYALFPNLSVAENVVYGLKVRGIAAAERSAISARRRSSCVEFPASTSWVVRS
mgnify:CR=1 FL=1